MTKATKELSRMDESRAFTPSERVTNSRKLSTRASETRFEDARPQAYQSSNPLDIPKEWQTEGYRYRWVTHMVRNTPNTIGMLQAQRSGWEPVPIEEMPQMRYNKFFGGANELDKWIVIDENMLFKRLTEECEKDDARFYARHDQKLKDMASIEKDTMSKFGLPVREVEAQGYQKY